MELVLTLTAVNSYFEFYFLGYLRFAAYSILSGYVCPVVFPGGEDPTCRWELGTLELTVRQECFYGEHPWDVGDLLIVPQDADMMSEVTFSSDSSKTTRYARHRDKSNVIIKTAL